MTLLLSASGDEGKNEEEGQRICLSTFFVLRKKHYEDAVMLLNKAIKEERREPGLYTNRGG